MNIPADPLTRLLSRAKARAYEVEKQKLLVSSTASDSAIAADFAARLAEKARFRTLLSDDRLDAERFRYYFTHIHDGTETLDSFRRWIDGRMNRG